MSGTEGTAVQPIRPAATVIIARAAAADAGFEIFMLRRTSRAAFAGGMYVFPGGRVLRRRGRLFAIGRNLVLADRIQEGGRAGEVWICSRTHAAVASKVSVDRDRTVEPATADGEGGAVHRVLGLRGERLISLLTAVEKNVERSYDEVVSLREKQAQADEEIRELKALLQEMLEIAAKAEAHEPRIPIGETVEVIERLVKMLSSLGERRGGKPSTKRRRVIMKTQARKRTIEKPLDQPPCEM